MQAFYDEKPSVLEAVGNGSYLYRYNISEETTEVLTETESNHANSKTQWSCQEVTVFAPLTSNRITEAVIADRWDSTHEQKLVNEYNAASLGLIGGGSDSEEAEKRITAYREFLTERAELKEQVDADCSNLGIK